MYSTFGGNARIRRFFEIYTQVLQLLPPGRSDRIKELSFLQAEN